MKDELFKVMEIQQNRKRLEEYAEKNKDGTLLSTQVPTQPLTTLDSLQLRLIAEATHDLSNNSGNTEKQIWMNLCAKAG